MGKYHFIIIGAGWRALYYVRIAKAMPDIFCLDAVYCRTQEKADKIAREYQIHTTTSKEECAAYKPDFAVIAVNKAEICNVAVEWMDRGITVLSETPAALDIEALKKLYGYYKAGKKQVVAEQYREYPSNKAALRLMGSGIIGDVNCMNISLAHEYHGVSLMRAYLGIRPDENFTVSGNMNFQQQKRLQDMSSLRTEELPIRKGVLRHLNMTAVRRHGMTLILNSTDPLSAKIPLKFRAYGVK